MTRRYDLADQELASWLAWFYRRERNHLFPMTKGGYESRLTAAEEGMVWDRVLFLARDRFPGEDETRLDAVAGRVRAAFAAIPDPVTWTPTRTQEQIHAAATRNARTGLRRS